MGGGGKGEKALRRQAEGGLVTSRREEIILRTKFTSLLNLPLVGHSTKKATQRRPKKGRDSGTENVFKIDKA